MTFTEEFTISTVIPGVRSRAERNIRVTYTMTRARAATSQEPAEPSGVDEMSFEVMHGTKWDKASDDMHDLLIDVLGDDLGWLADSAKEQAMDAAHDAADHKRRLARDDAA